MEKLKATNPAGDTFKVVALWTIPAACMKRGKDGKENGDPHLVPLSTQAVAVLRDLHPLTGHGALVFPGERDGASCRNATRIWRNQRNLCRDNGLPVISRGEMSEIRCQYNRSSPMWAIVATSAATCATISFI
ncbi:hypothetical protein ACX12L_16710 [Alicycliphilus sp. T452]